MTKQELLEQIKEKKSFLCVGLDPDIRRLPEHLHSEDNPMFAFNKAIIDATASSCVAFMPHIAFYEAMGTWGIDVLEQTILYIKEQYPHHLILIDAKRGDLPYISSLYGRAMFDFFHADGITLSTCVGQKSVDSFLEWSDKWLILPAFSCEKEEDELSFQKMEDGRFLYEHLLERSLKWSDSEHFMYSIISASQERLKHLRSLLSDHLLFFNHIDKDDDNLEEQWEACMTESVDVLVHSSESLLYCDDSEHFASKVGQEAENLRRRMEFLIQSKNLFKVKEGEN